MTCLDCGCAKSPDLFNKDKSRPDGLAAYCRPCFKVRRDRWYHANKADVRMQQDTVGGVVRRRQNGAYIIPGWFEEDKVRTVYAKARELGMTVDHIVPTKSDVVCGLHCWDNLQLLTRGANASKGNRSWPDQP